MFQSLSDRLSGILDKLTRRGVADRERRRRGHARGAPRAARGRRRARCGARLHRQGEGEGRRPGCRATRSRRARWSSRSSTTSSSPCWARTPQPIDLAAAAAGRHHAGRPAGLRQDDDDGQDRQAPHRPRQEEGADGLARHAPPGGAGAAPRPGRADQVDTLPIVAGQTPQQIARRALDAARLGGYDVVHARHRRAAPTSTKR